MANERAWLQRAVAIAGIVPFAAGLTGVLFGAGLTGDQISVSGDSHYRYLSGLLLGIGLLAWSTIPRIELQTGRLQLLTLIVVAGGLSRLVGLGLTGLPSIPMLAALGMELGVTPLICLWQMRVARAYRSAEASRLANPNSAEFEMSPSSRRSPVAP